MCAGNTPEEALVQGLCEVAERYVCRVICLGEVNGIPTIPLRSLEGSPIHRHVVALIDRGYDVTIKDCTLGGRFPVMGTIVSPKERKDLYHVNVASAPTLAVTLSRCLTETFQGLDDLEATASRIAYDFNFPRPETQGWNSELSRRRYELLLHSYNSSGRFPNEFFRAGGEPHIAQAFLEEGEDNRRQLDFVVDRFKRDGATIHVRDVSFLGFPSYLFYVRGYSNKEVLEHPKMFLRGLDFWKESTLARLKSCTIEEIRGLAQSLHEMINDPDLQWFARILDPARHLARVILSDESDMVTQFSDSDRLMSYLFLRVGDYERALGYYRRTFDKDRARGEAATPYAVACLGFLQMKVDGANAGEIQASLSSLFGEETAMEIQNDLGQPEKVFQYLTLPECGDCSSCPVARECRFEQWHRLFHTLRAEAKRNPVSQQGLRAVFGRA